jgi:hypothetical protein
MARATTPLCTVLAARDLIGDREDANRIVMRLLVDRLAAHRGLTAPAWPMLASPLEDVALEAPRRLLGDLDVTDWDYTDVGTAYERLVPVKEVAYTPPQIAGFMTRFSLDLQLDRLARHPDPGNVLQVLAVDPSCGAGAFLVPASRYIAARYAERLFGEVSDLTAAIVLPVVVSECIFGIDIDPVAVELCKASLWLELGGEQPLSYMDRNVICGNTLGAPHVQPPKLAERLAEGDQPREFPADRLPLR